MNEINYEELLYNCKRISIPIDDVSNFCLKSDIKLLPSRHIFDKLHFEDKMINILWKFVYFDITKDGIKYNLSKFKSALKKIYGIEDINENGINSFINKLNNIENEEELSEILRSEFNSFRNNKKYNFYRDKLIKEKYGDKIVPKRTIRNLNHQIKTTKDIELKSELTREKNRYKNYASQLKRDINKLFLSDFKPKKVYELNYLLELSENDFEIIQKTIDDKIEYIDFEKLKFLLNFTILEVYKKETNDNKKEILKTYIKHYLDENNDKIKDKYFLYYHKETYCGEVRIKKYSIETLVKGINYYSTINTNQKKEVNNEDKNEVKTFNYSFFECDVNKTREILGKYLRLGESKYNSEKAKEFLKRKIAFYEKLDYVKLYRGSDSFDGYMGFVLEDGTVILDKFFKNFKTGRITISDAIYIVLEKDFEVITKMSKKECIGKIKEGTIICERIPHDNNYEENVNNTIKSKKLMMQ